MKTLITNDDGIASEGLWLLADAFQPMGEVVIAAPDREQSAVGTAVTLRRPLKVTRQKAPEADVDGVQAYAVNGTPSDCVILGLDKLAGGGVSLVVSGINDGLNCGEDVLISGTVSAALQAYLRGFPAIAVSVPLGAYGRLGAAAAKMATGLAGNLFGSDSLADVFLNINLPDESLKGIKGVRVTRLATRSHHNTVAETKRGEEIEYTLIREKTAHCTDQTTDVWAVENGYVSVTPLYTRHFDKSLLPSIDRLGNQLSRQITER
ncbi:5'/3'-nucleotidase SurE [Chloroflexota bacterium]